MFMPAVPRSRRGWGCPGRAALVALLLLCGCATGAPPGGLAGWRDEDSSHSVPPVRAVRAPGVQPTRPRTFSGEVHPSASSGPASSDEPSGLMARPQEESPDAREERWQAVEAKLEEYLQWGMRLMETHAARLRRIAPGHLLTEHPLREQSINAPERFLSLLGAVLPVIHGRLLKEGGEAALGRVALVTGRSLDEVEVLSRVASHLGPEEVHEIERLLHSASAGHSFTQAELEFLNRVARRLETPLREAAQALSRGEKVAMLGSRTLSDGSRLLPGTPAHLAQCWVDYQFRHPGKYRRFSYAVDPEWERLYRTILANKPAGNAFEEAILKTSGYTKNTAMMVPPPGSKSLGFIPDSVPGNSGELVWGKPYSFVEAKARNELALTGNLKAMLEYVRDYGGHLELWVRSAQHPAGATRFTQPLEKC